MRRIGLLVLAGILLACSGATALEGSMEVELDEFYIEPASPLIKAGTIELDLRNGGEIPHTLVVATSEGTVLAASDSVMPARTETLTVNLEPGTYQLTCRIVVRGDDGSLVDHYEKGMGTTLTVEP